jgi:hypothetical protein
MALRGKARHGTALDQIHQERVEPGKVPGGIWVRVCTRNRLLTEYGLTNPETADASGEADAELILANDERPVWTYFYDGDSGECLRTIIAR